MNSKRRSSKKFLNQFNFDEIDHRLSCGWHAEIEGIAQRKKYLIEIKHSQQNIIEKELRAN